MVFKYMDGPTLLHTCQASRILCRYAHEFVSTSKKDELLSLAISTQSTGLLLDLIRLDADFAKRDPKQLLREAIRAGHTGGISLLLSAFDSTQHAKGTDTLLEIFLYALHERRITDRRMYLYHAIAAMKKENRKPGPIVRTTGPRVSPEDDAAAILQFKRDWSVEDPCASTRTVKPNATRNSARWTIEDVKTEPKLSGWTMHLTDDETCFRQDSPKALMSPVYLQHRLFCIFEEAEPAWIDTYKQTWSHRLCRTGSCGSWITFKNIYRTFQASYHGTQESSDLALELMGWLSMLAQAQPPSTLFF